MTSQVDMPIFWEHSWKRVVSNYEGILYSAWVESQLSTNGLAFLPIITSKQEQKLQTAMNSTVRAVAGLPRRGTFPISKVRSELKIRSVKSVRDRSLAFEAWKRFGCRVSRSDGPTTRARMSMKIPVPDIRGWRGRAIESHCKIMWNRLPTEIRKENERRRSKLIIKK